jgi:hypothetical protein
MRLSRAHDPGWAEASRHRVLTAPRLLDRRGDEHGKATYS